jgi:hypothetical protein
MTISFFKRMSGIQKFTGEPLVNKERGQNLPGLQKNKSTTPLTYKPTFGE